MADTQTPPPTAVVPKDEEQSYKPNPILSLFSKFAQSFNFPLPKPKPETTVTVSETKPPGPAAETDGGESKTPPDIVKVPNRQTVAPLRLEAEELEQDTNPVVLWQVYAIGGFFVLRWAWARWNERMAKKKSTKKSTNEDPPPADD